MHRDDFSFLGVPVRVEPNMAGRTNALRLGDGPIVVSPAIGDLIGRSSPAQLERLAAHLQVLRVSDPLGEAA